MARRHRAHPAGRGGGLLADPVEAAPGATSTCSSPAPTWAACRRPAEDVKRRLREYAGVYEVTDSFRAGKEEMRLGIKPAARPSA